MAPPLKAHTATCLSGAPVCDSMTCHTEPPMTTSSGLLVRVRRDD